ncbi:hypothetical protein B0H12DRAFT_1115731 [Mycena haematopus]|nr:hypothetical protein B0H12DRAFT_1115731 [Mycena haematopus]
MSFLELAPELQLSIISNLSFADKHCLRLASRALNNLLILDLPLEQLRVARQKKTIFVVDGAKAGGLGFEPFIIRNSRKIPRDSAQHEHILVDIYYPPFMQNNDEDDQSIENEWRIYIHMKKLSLDTDNKLSSKSTRLVKSIDYELLRGKLVRASAGLLRTRFNCPECGNSRSVCPGCGGFSMRFSELFCSCGWAMPCPVCIGYGVAYDAKYIQDDEEALDELWKEIDEMLAEDNTGATD